jgi:hypothetical protein
LERGVREGGGQDAGSFMGWLLGICRLDRVEKMLGYLWTWNKKY